jgi:hypothetical protein
VGKIAVLVVGVVDHTGFELQEQVEVELAQLGEHMAAQILRRPEADKEYTVELQGVVVVVAVAVAVAETAPAVHVAVAVAVAAAAAIGSFVNHHNHNLRTKQIAPVEGAVVNVQVQGPGQMATVGCTLAALEADLLVVLQWPPNKPNNLAGCSEGVVDLGAAVVGEGCKEVVAAQMDFYAS